MISWFGGQARLANFTASGRGKVTTLTIKIDVSDPETLRSILRDIQEMQSAQSAPVNHKEGSFHG